MPAADLFRISHETVLDADNPWPGLVSFAEADQDYFRGREREKRDLLRLVLRERASVLYGLSGLGKTSLIQAGLFPLARREALLPITVRFDFTANAADLVQQVKEFIMARAGEGIEIPPFRPGESLWEYFHRRGNEFWGERLFTPLLVFDQFEEVFTVGSGVEPLLEELADLAAGSPPAALRLRVDRDPDLARGFQFSNHPYRLLFSIREDFFASLEPLFQKARGLELRRFQLLPMNGQAALDVVNQASGFVDPAVAERIVRFIAAKEVSTDPPAAWTVEPALLSLFCRELSDRRNGGPITDELVSGSRDRILAGFYERSMQGLSADVRRFVEDELLTDSGYRNSVPLDNLRRYGLTEASLGTLAARRLIHVGQWGATRRVEITHDRLTGVVRASRDHRREREAREQVERARENAERELGRSRRRTALFAALAGLSLVMLFLALWSQSSARKAERAARAALAISDWKEADDRIAAGETGRALAYLARALRSDGQSAAIRLRTYSLLTMRGWHLPSAVLRHQGAVAMATFNPDGRLVLTASNDGTARVWYAATGRPAGEPLRHEGKIHSAFFSPDGRQVVTASADGTARLWDAATSKPLGEPLRHEHEVNWAVFSPDGGQLATVTTDTVQVWSAGTGKPLGPPIRPDQAIFYMAAFSPDGRQLVTTSENFKAHIWNPATGKRIHELIGHGGIVSFAAFSPDGGRVLTASDDGTARVWDATTGKPLGSPLRHDKKEISSKNAVNSAVFSPDGRLIVTASDDGTARVWETATGHAIGEPLRHQLQVNWAAFSADGSRVVTASADGTARIWDAATGKAVGEPLRHQKIVNRAAFSPDGRSVATASDDGTARIWQAIAPGAVGQPFPDGAGIKTAAFSPDGRLVVTGAFDGTARVWDAATVKAVGEPLKHRKEVNLAVFSPDGARVVTASADGTAQVWDAATGKPIGDALHHESPVRWAAFSPDGRRVVTASQDGAGIWSADTGKALGGPLAHKGALWAEFSPDGRRIATNSGTAMLWDAATGTTIGAPMHHLAIVSAAFSPDSRWLATAGFDQTARIWDSATANAVGAPLQHKGWVRSVAFSPDGRRLATASDDHTAQVWESATGKPVGDALRHDGPVRWVTFSFDGAQVLTASVDGTARVWDGGTGKMLSEPLRHSSLAWPPAFSRSGRQVLTVGTARIWEILPGFPIESSHLADWAELAGLYRINELGTPEPIDDPGERLRQLRAAPEDALTKWLFADPWSRAVSPSRSLTIPEYLGMGYGRDDPGFAGNPLLRIH